MPGQSGPATNPDRRSNEQAQSVAAIDFVYVEAYQGDTPKPPVIGSDLFTDEIERRRLDVVDLMELEAELGLSVVLGRNLFRWVRDFNAVNSYPH